MGAAFVEVPVASDVEENNSNEDAAVRKTRASEGDGGVKATHDGAEIKARYASGTNTLIAGDGTFMMPNSQSQSSKSSLLLVVDERMHDEGGPELAHEGNLLKHRPRTEKINFAGFNLRAL